METSNGTASITFLRGAMRREVGEVAAEPMLIVRASRIRTRRLRPPVRANVSIRDQQGEVGEPRIQRALLPRRLDRCLRPDDVRFRRSRAPAELLSVWHYTISGADDTEVQAFRDRLTKQPPRQGGVQVTNEKVAIQANAPDLHGADMSAGASMVKLYGLGGAGLPGVFFADGTDANRASALEMNAPAVKKFMDRQNNMDALLCRVLGYVIDSAVLAGVLPESQHRLFLV